MPPDDDVTGIGRVVVFIGFFLALVVGIAVGRLARRPGEPSKPDGGLSN